MNSKIGLSALACAASLAFAGQAAAATTITSTFDTGAEGWGFGDLSFPNQTVSYDAAAQALVKQHGFAGWGFLAPTKFLGDKSEYVGGTLAFDFSAVGVNYDRPLVVLTGANNKQVFMRWGPKPGPQLQTFSVQLSAANFYTGSATDVGGNVSDSAFAEIMGNLKQVQVWGDWNPGMDIVKLDNVVLSGPTAVPEPATWALMIMGFGTAGAMLRRRRLAIA